MDKDDVIDTLNELIEVSKDGEYGFRTSAEYLRDPNIKQRFMQHADECARAAAELQPYVAERGGDPEDTGSTAGALHRGWVALKGKLSGYSDLQILEETERGEDKAVATYRVCLGKGLPDPLRSIVETQFHGVQRNHAEVRALREQARMGAR
ncbi:MAG: PA2169 family four-helix-bundle protein [Betaproteobacteria bacterium]|jgi:uncharacterized protein (TIGR02284 family)|nr:PA2169 family four-helix-bundle protein [Betaproteobacteria bacterium]MCC6246672.1 PA2169 family four-helix-bundle protein [Rubrivivax sp.]MCL4697043.1 PA2169 family four-helix-bundle protein [Burkholderiaceae bacterium]